MNRFMYRINKIIYRLTKNKRSNYYCYYYKNCKKYTGNKIIIIDNNTEKELPASTYFDNLNIKWEGSDNTVIIPAIDNIYNSEIVFNGNGNTISFGENPIGQFSLTCYENNSKMSFGKNIDCRFVSVSIHNEDQFTMGDNCLVADLLFCTTDGHSVIDKETKKLLNVPPYNVKIGNNVWICREVRLLKNACIPNNCIVGMNSIVTKSFNEENCVIAGNPAKIVKRNIEWSSCKPSEYKREGVML